MNLTKAVQIAVEAIRVQRLKVTCATDLLRKYHIDNARNRAFAEVYDSYTAAIDLLKVVDAASDRLVLVTEPDLPAHQAVTTVEATASQVVPGSPAIADHAVTTPAQTAGAKDEIDRDIERRR